MTRALREAAERATPGPWTAHKAGERYRRRASVTSPLGRSLAVCSYYPFTADAREFANADAAYIAAADPTTVLALLDDRDRLQRERDEARGDAATEMAKRYEWMAKEHAQFERAEAALALVAKLREPIRMTVTDVRDLHKFAGLEEEDSAGDVTLQWFDEHEDGPGWYVYLTDYPEEGSVPLCLAAEEPRT